MVCIPLLSFLYLYRHCTIQLLKYFPVISEVVGKLHNN